MTIKETMVRDGLTDVSVESGRHLVTVVFEGNGEVSLDSKEARWLMNSLRRAIRKVARKRRGK